jgi:CRP/FNR family cyclic AMP-dependent transcriptional regulator
VSAERESRTTQVLHGVPYFSRLDADALEAISRSAVSRHYGRGEVIFLEGDPVAGLFIVDQGRVKLYKLSTEGREQVVRLVGPGEFFNEVAVLDGGPNPVGAMALRESQVWVIDREDLLRLLELHPPVAVAVIEALAGHARHLVSLVEDLSLRTVSARLAKLLLTQAAGGGETPRRLTQQEMAAQLGTVREMVGRALRDLEEDGVIRFDRHRILILDRKALEEKAMM